MADVQAVHPQPVTEAPAAPAYGVAGNFAGPDELMHAIAELRKAGYSRLEAFTPFPIHGIDDALGDKRSPLGYIVFCGGATGFTFGTLLQWWTGAVDYPITIGGKPFFAFPPSIPVMFESTVLFSAFTAVFGMIALNGLPRLYHSIFNYSKHKRVTDDAFVLVVKSFDSKYDEAALRDKFAALGATDIEVVEE